MLWAVNEFTGETVSSGVMSRFVDIFLRLLGNYLRDYEITDKLNIPLMFIHFRLFCVLHLLVKRKR